MREMAWSTTTESVACAGSDSTVMLQSPDTSLATRARVPPPSLAVAARRRAEAVASSLAVNFGVNDPAKGVGTGTAWPPSSAVDPSAPALHVQGASGDSLTQALSLL